MQAQGADPSFIDGVTPPLKLSELLNHGVVLRPYYSYSEPLGTILHSRACRIFRSGVHAHSDAGAHALHTQNTRWIKTTYVGSILFGAFKKK